MALRRIAPKIFKRVHCLVGLLFILISAGVSGASDFNDSGEFEIRYRNGPEGDGRYTEITITNAKGIYCRRRPDENVSPQNLTITDEEKWELVNFIMSSDFFSLKKIIYEGLDFPPNLQEMNFSLTINGQEHDVSTVYCGRGFINYCDAIKNKTINSICNKMFNIIAPAIKKIRNHQDSPERTSTVNKEQTPQRKSTIIK